MLSSSIPRAIPRSISLTRPSGVSITFAGLTSRCTIPAACATASASPTRAAIMVARSAGSGPSCRTTSASVVPGTSSMTMK